MRDRGKAAESWDSGRTALLHAVLMKVLIARFTFTPIFSLLII